MLLAQCGIMSLKLFEEMNCGRFHIYFGCHFILLQFVKLEIYFIPTSDVCGVFGCE